MRARLVMLIAVGCLLAGGLLLWLETPNHFSNYLTRWTVQNYREETGAPGVSIPVDMRSRVWPTVIGMGLLLSGVFLFAMVIGLGTRRSWLPAMSRIGARKAVVLAMVPVLAIVALWRPAVVQYHRIAMRSWHTQPSPSWDRHQLALVALGYFRQSEFALERRALSHNGEFMHFVDAASFRDDQWTFEPHSNHVNVTAYRGDMKTWAEVVRRFDQGEPVPPLEPPPRVSISNAPNRPTLNSLPVPGPGDGR